MDSTINAKLRENSEHLARAYLELADLLRSMSETGGYKLLGYDKWENYLATKSEFGRTYLSYLYKLGLAGDLRPYLDQGISASKFIEFAKRTDYPEKIPQLIEATWEEVRDKSVRETGKVLDGYVASHQEEYRRPRKRTGAGRPKLTWQQRFRGQFEALDEAQRAQYVGQMKAFLKELGGKA